MRSLCMSGRLLRHMMMITALAGILLSCFGCGSGYSETHEWTGEEWKTTTTGTPPSDDEGPTKKVPAAAVGNQEISRQRRTEQNGQVKEKAKQLFLDWTDGHWDGDELVLGKTSWTPEKRGFFARHNSIRFSDFRSARIIKPLGATCYQVHFYKKTNASIFAISEIQFRAFDSESAQHLVDAARVLGARIE